MKKLGLLRNAFWNYLGHLFELAIGAALVAYVVRHVGVAEYGVFILANSIFALLTIFDFGLHSLLVQAFVAEKSCSGLEGVSRLLSTAFLASASLGAAGLLVCFGVAAILPGPFRLSLELFCSRGHRGNDLHFKKSACRSCRRGFQDVCVTFGYRLPA